MLSAAGFFVAVAAISFAVAWFLCEIVVRVITWLER